MEIKNLSFKVISGKVPKEMQEASSEGMKEVYREAIPGGFNVVMAFPVIGAIGKGRKQLFVLEKMPPKELVNLEIGEKQVPLQEVEFQTKEELLHGKYGIVQGRKFLCIGKDNEKPTVAADKSTGKSKKVS